MMMGNVRILAPTAWTALFLAAAIVGASAGEIAIPRLEVLDGFEIPATGALSVGVEELSGLAWDQDEKLLYAASDGGLLHQFRLELEGDRIVRIEHVFSAPLAAPLGAGTATNAEGLAALNGDNGKPGDTELLIAFEDGPAIARFTPAGQWIANVVLPGPLADASNYARKNSRLESVTVDKAHGVLTAPERPLRGGSAALHKLYAADGETWAFSAVEPEGRIKAIETMADGNLLVLERTEEEGRPHRARLRYLDLAACAAAAECNARDLTADPDPRFIDNFEGMARLSDDLVLIVTDRTKKDAEPASFALFKVTAAQ